MFRLNPNFESKLRTERAHLKGLAAAAEPAREEADRLAKDAGAPWMARKGIDTVVADATDHGVFLVNTDHAGHLQEWGGRNNPPHAPLRRGARAAGLRLDEH